MRRCDHSRELASTPEVELPRREDDRLTEKRGAVRRDVLRVLVVRADEEKRPSGIPGERRRDERLVYRAQSSRRDGALAPLERFREDAVLRQFSDCVK